jgi:hypothetical protein
MRNPLANAASRPLADCLSPRDDTGGTWSADLPAGRAVTGARPLRPGLTGAGERAAAVPGLVAARRLELAAREVTAGYIQAADRDLRAAG